MISETKFICPFEIAKWKALHPDFLVFIVKISLYVIYLYFGDNLTSYN